jgi:hypothetical protein
MPEYLQNAAVTLKRQPNLKVKSRHNIFQLKYFQGSLFHSTSLSHTGSSSKTHKFSQFDFTSHPQPQDGRSSSKRAKKKNTHFPDLHFVTTFKFHT